MGSLSGRAGVGLTWIVAIAITCGCATVTPPPAPESTSPAAHAPRIRARTAEGILAFLDGDFQRAERLLRNAVVSDRSDSLAHYYLAQAYLARDTVAGRVAAEETLADLVLLSGDEPIYLRALAELRLEQGYRSNARRVLEHLTEVRPDDPETWYLIGRLAEGDWWRFQFRQDRHRAVEAFERALARDGAHLESALRLAVLAVEADSLDEAEVYATALRRHHPDRVETALLNGVLHVGRGEYGAAEATFRRAIGDLPGFEQTAYWSTEFLERKAGLEWIDVFDDDEEEPPPEPATTAWEKRDPTPGSRVNERFAIHAARVTMANWLYSVPELELSGADTAPGEFYIRYGKPLRRSYRAEKPPQWLHTFDVDDRPVLIRFFDYGHNGNFMLAIERNARPIHAVLIEETPESTPLARTHRLPAIDVASYWFRNPDGEPRLEIVAGGRGRPVWFEAGVADSAWRERYQVTERIVPRALPATRPLARRGVFTATLLPGADARYLRGWLRPLGSIEDTLSAPPRREGFDVSSLVPQVETPRGFVPNPQLPYPLGDVVHLYLEIYGVRRDASNLGRVEIKLSFIPVERPRGVIASLFSNPETPSYVTNEFREDVDREPWARTLSIDTSDLAPGVYRARVDVRDVITGETGTRESLVELVPPETSPIEPDTRN